MTGAGALRETRRGHLAMLAFSALIGGSFSLGSDAAAFIEPAALNAARFAIAAAVVGALALALRQMPAGTFRAPWRYLVLGGLFAVYFVTMFVALKTVSAVSTSAVFTLTPFIAAMIGWGVLGQKMSARMAAALTIGAVGALWVIFRADLNAFLSFDVGRGEMIFFAGCVAHAIYPTASRAMNRGEAPLAVNFGMLIAGLILLVAYGWQDIRETDWTSLPAIVWVTIFYTAVIAGATTFNLLQFAATRLPAGKLMAYTYLVPAWVLGWEVLRGKSWPEPLILVGVGLTVVSLLVLLRDAD